jgi:glutathione peroxidase
MRKVFAFLFMLFAAPLAAQNMSPADNAFAFSFTDIDGKPLPLSAYRGKVVLIVNTASQCGFTPQYAELQQLYETYKDRGLVVLGVPSDNFGGQEPDDEKAIKKFTSEKFHITFPLASKTDVAGDKAHPFYAWAAKQPNSGLLGATPRWNFHKFLIGRDGQLLDSFVSTVLPASTTITDALGKALK